MIKITLASTAILFTFLSSFSHTDSLRIAIERAEARQDTIAAYILYNKLGECYLKQGKPDLAYAALMESPAPNTWFVSTRNRELLADSKRQILIRRNLILMGILFGCVLILLSLIIYNRMKIQQNRLRISYISRYLDIMLCQNTIIREEVCCGDKLNAIKDLDLMDEIINSAKVPAS